MTGESDAVGLSDVSVLIPSSADEAVAAFGDGKDVTVVAGGTIVLPDLVAGRLRPKSALFLGRAGLSGIARADGRVTIGAATPVSELADADAPLAEAARHVGDLEVRAQATVGGNLCSVASDDAPRGDLQAPLLALAASVRSTGKDGEKTEPLEDFLADGARPARARRLLRRRRRGRRRYVVARAPAHTPLHDPRGRGRDARDGELRVAATGVGPQGRPLVERGGRRPRAALEPPRRRARVGVVPRAAAARASSSAPSPTSRRAG